MYATPEIQAMLMCKTDANPFFIKLEALNSADALIEISAKHPQAVALYFVSRSGCDKIATREGGWELTAHIGIRN